jgi:hypothetical protein
VPMGGLDRVIGAKPEKGVSPGHMVSSAPGRDWLTPQAANKSRKSAAAPKALVSDTAAPNTAPASSPTTGRSAPSSAAAVGNVNRSPMSSVHDYSGVVGSIAHAGGAMAQNTPMASPQAARGRSGSAPDGPRLGGRSGAAPRSAEVGGGRVSGGSAGGLHIANEGNDNHFENIGNVTHNTTVHNYGTMTGNTIGNAGGAARGPGGSGTGGGRGRPGGGNGGEGGSHFDAWYKDSTGHHGLRQGLDHIAGRTGGSGERLDKEPGRRTVGGTQRPIKGSPRAAGATSPVPATGTGTTHNWQGPVAAPVASASGNGTAQQKTVP